MIFVVPLDSFHEGHFDLEAGLGLVVLPRTRDDVVLDGESLHAAAWEHVAADLTRMGWRPRRTATGDLRIGGLTSGARLTLEITSADQRSINPDPTAWCSLRTSAGVANATV